MAKEKLQKYIFILLLVLLPMQLGLHFWPEWSYVNGIRVDYLSPTLYATDLLILFLFILEIPKIKLGRLGALGFVGIFALINIYFSLSPDASVYKWLKVAEMGFLVWFVARRAKFEAKWLLIPVFYESILAIWQFWIQSSVGGLWYLLGERTFSASTPGIAQANIGGELWLRPYGTLPHPNVLAGFLIVSLLIIFQKFPHISRKITVAILTFGLVALILTLSRTSLLGFIRIEPDSWSGRWILTQKALEKWTGSPIWGTGLGTSFLYGAKVTNYALAFQPPHNIYLLVLAETGIVGFSAFVILLIRTFKYLLEIGNWKLKIALASVLVLGLFDHYFLTLQQGQLILALVLGLSFASMGDTLKKGGEDYGS